MSKEKTYQDGDFIDHTFVVGERVEKHTGDYVTFGEVRGVYVTKKGKLRYVVEIEPQGLQMIWGEKELRAAPRNNPHDHQSIGSIAARETALDPALLLATVYLNCIMNANGAT